MGLDILDSLNEEEFVEKYVKENIPVIVRDSSFSENSCSPEIFKSHVGDFMVQVYDDLFDLQELSTLSDYIDNNFNKQEFRESVPYVRWYNQLKDVDYSWSDKGFAKIKDLWKRPSFIPVSDFVIPPTAGLGQPVDPVYDAFPYRGILVAAKNARTRMHRDPFCTDAVVSQLYGEKEVALYSPDRTDEFTLTEKGASFGTYLDVRKDNLHQLSVEPTYHGFISPGDVVYIPHGWLHDVIVKKDSISVTWNFIHKSGALDFIDYLMDGPENDSEFEVLRYFYSLAGKKFDNASEILDEYRDEFMEIESA